MSRVENQMERLAERAKAIKLLEATYGRVEISRGRSAAVNVLGLILEWDEAMKIAEALLEKAKREKAALRASRNDAKRQKEECL